MTEFTGSVRMAKFEVHVVDGDWSLSVSRWFELADQCKQIVNCIWQTWLVWHVQNGSADLLRTWLNDRQENGKKQAGKCPVQAVPSELQKHIQATVSKVFVNVNSRVASLVLNTTISDLKRRKASKGALPGHTAILLWHQSIPSSTKPQPIPFDRQNAKIVPPKEPGGNYGVEFRLWRLPTDKQKSPSVIDSVMLRCQGRRVRSQVAIIKKIASGKYKFCGSNLVYDRSKKKWFVHVCYRQPKDVATDVNPELVATLAPDSKRPLSLRYPGDKRRDYLIGLGHFVSAQRKRIFLQRRSRANYHRVANTNRKGHGRSRAQNWRWKLQKAWLSFVKRTNHVLTSRAVQRCVERGIGTLVYFQPTEEFAQSRFLSVAGKDEKWNDATSWEYYQLGSMLEYKCKRAGIKLVTQKV